jgi:uncharacterized protein (TIGR02996 family)
MMPGTDAEFLRLILADPDADGPRLVYADWLESRADADRAEFIRVQCASAMLSSDDPRLASLVCRAEILLEQHRAEWGRPLSGFATRWDWRRGFPEFVRMTAGTFFERGEEMFAAVPVRHVELLAVERFLSDLRVSPLVGRLAGMTIAYQPAAGDAIAKAVAASSATGGLDELELSRCGIGDDGATALAGSPCLTRLRRLALNGNRISEDGKRRLLAAPQFRSVVAWDLRDNLST